tara:strand:+ start:309 stop:491 length:183 start_codon:yes stop_codon:yes gene_type:complete
MNGRTTEIQKIAGVNLEQALDIQETIDSEGLLDWSEATAREIVKATYIAQAFIANGRSWE